MEILDFGTAGIRGIVGKENHQLNEAHVARVIDGYSRYLINEFDDAKSRGIVIGRDNRIKGKDFSAIAVNILTSYGIKVYFNNKMLPTPFISYMIKHKNAIGAINITASHNPKEYNGIKLYNSFGYQILPNEVNEIKSFFNEYENYKKYNELNQIKIIDSNLIYNITSDDYDSYINEVLKLNFNNVDISNVKIVYSPLHGTGYEFASKIFKKINANVFYEENEIIEDEKFAYVENPNPECVVAFKNTIKLAEKTNADIIIITDPDSDRLGVALKVENEYKLLTGNEVAILIMNYLIENKVRDKNKIYYIVNSFVSTSLPIKMCLENNIKTYVTDTGFKWIGHKIEELKNQEEFLFAFEESYGSLINGNIARDKDAIQSLLMISIIASISKKNNMNLNQELDAIYKKYGYVVSKSFSYDLESQDHLKVIENKFANLPFLDAKFVDYNKGIESIEKTNAFFYRFNDSLNWICLRPSGTEPKFKIYIHVVEKTLLEAQEKFNYIYEIAKKVFE